ncbi:MAG: monovalent cation/H+ antiporter complex subunit F [Thermomicrobiales bacterium]
MHETVFYVAAVWMTGLLGACALMVIRARSTMVRILALDTVTLLLIAVLVLYSGSQRSSYYLDAALILALLSFAATVAAARYHIEGKVFG